jgi:hypothetical protein
MAGSSEYHHGEMDIRAQKGMWDGFMKASAFGAILTLIFVGFLTLTFGVGLNWLISLVLMLVAGGVIGFVMGMGASWIATLIIFALTIAFSRFVIFLFSLAL